MGEIPIIYRRDNPWFKAFQKQRIAPIHLPGVVETCIQKSVVAPAVLVEFAVCSHSRFCVSACHLEAWPARPKLLEISASTSNRIIPMPTRLFEAIPYRTSPVDSCRSLDCGQNSGKSTRRSKTPTSSIWAIRFISSMLMVNPVYASSAAVLDLLMEAID